MNALRGAVRGTAMVAYMIIMIFGIGVMLFFFGSKPTDQLLRDMSRHTDVYARGLMRATIISFLGIVCYFIVLAVLGAKHG